MEQNESRDGQRLEGEDRRSSRRHRRHKRRLFPVSWLIILLETLCIAGVLIWAANMASENKKFVAREKELRQRCINGLGMPLDPPNH